MSYSAPITAAAISIYESRVFRLPPAGGVSTGQRGDERYRREHDDPGLLDTGQGARGGPSQAAEERRVIKACSLEVSCRSEERYLDDDLSRYDNVMQIFYNYMYQNKEDVAFINAHNIRSFDPDWAVGKVGGDADLDHWRRYVSVFKALHGPPA